jgi:hypothetical protein
MALSVAKGTLTAPATTGVQSYTVGFQPKLVLLWHAGVSTVSGTVTAGGHGGYGAIDGTSQWAHAWGADDVVTSSNAGQNFRTNAAVLIATSGTPTISGVAAFDSFTLTTFTLNWTTASATIQNSIIHWMAFGGADLTNVSVGAANFATANGSQTVSFLGFQPDALITCAAWHASGGANAVDSHTALGFAANTGGTITQGAAQYFDNDASTAMDCALSMLNTACLVTNAAAASTTPITAILTAFTSTGWTWTWSNTTTANMLYGFVAIKGPAVKVVSETSSASNLTKQTTGVGFQPKGLMHVATGRTTLGTSISALPDNTAQLTIGGTDGTNHGVTSQIQFDGHADSQAKKVTLTGRSLHNPWYSTTVTTAGNRATLQIEAFGVPALQSDGWAITYTNTSGVTWYYQTLVLGDAPAAPADPYPLPYRPKLEQNAVYRM